MDWVLLPRFLFEGVSIVVEDDDTVLFGKIYDTFWNELLAEAPLTSDPYDEARNLGRLYFDDMLLLLDEFISSLALYLLSTVVILLN